MGLRETYAAMARQADLHARSLAERTDAVEAEVHEAVLAEDGCTRDTFTRARLLTLLAGLEYPVHRLGRPHKSRLVSLVPSAIDAARREIEAQTIRAGVCRAAAAEEN